ncbi:MAG: ABC transporter substrate-binding protein [Fusobacterium sp.]|uniref:ABC transporter substrate-binding protein n=1 Tax=Fusobacterium sp. TaxID=68766 RepID=UPI002942946D|nr:ABC transporter substrate-binding protein [Fusobacterium sp.]MDY3060668.1 ABC transporter substrate-binding protein [Fusobacterium sp.]MEE1475233.1 ABC transporter substrate-binding protein [Fusobacterium sp.]
MIKKIKIILLIMLSLILTQSLIAKENFTIEQNDEKLELLYFPKKIVTDSAIISRFLAALDIELVGVPSSTTKIPEKYNGVQRIGRSGMPDLEIVKSLKTDLVVSTLYSKPALKPKYDNLNIPSFYLKVDTYDESMEVIEILGKAFHKEEKANAILKDIKHREEILHEKLKDKEPKKIAIIYGNGESFFMTGKNHFLQGLMDKIDCENIVTSIDNSALLKKSVPFSMEQLIKANPDVILRLPTSQTKNGESFEEIFNANPIWKLTKAYKNKKILDIDPTLFRMSAGVNSIDALEELYRYVYE